MACFKYYTYGVFICLMDNFTSFYFIQDQNVNSSLRRPKPPMMNCPNIESAAPLLIPDSYAPKSPF